MNEIIKRLPETEQQPKYKSPDIERKQYRSQQYRSPSPLRVESQSVINVEMDETDKGQGHHYHPHTHLHPDL